MGGDNLNNARKHSLLEKNKELCREVEILTAERIRLFERLKKYEKTEIPTETITVIGFLTEPDPDITVFSKG